MNKLLLTLLFPSYLVLFSLVGSAQKMEIYGTVYDSSGVLPLKNSLAMAVRIKDSLLLGFTRTDINGKFEFKNLPIDTFSLIVSYPKCDKKTFFIFGSSTNTEISISSIKLSSLSKELDAVVIYANKNPIYYKGDTLVYVADSFKVTENAVVEDLLKKLPGIKVDKDGAITSQGKTINQVLVDGDEFFGSDPTIATKNLAAKGVESVKVYEKKSEKASDGDAATIQVLDLRLKADAKKGYFGKTSLATDFRHFHEGELLLNKFNGSQKISLYALGSTTPRTNVSRADMGKFGLDNARSKNSNAVGVPKTFSTGIYYSDKIGKRKQTKIGFNYNFNNYQIISSTASRSKYALPQDTSYYSDDSTHTVDLSESHRINFTLFSQLDSLTTFEIRPRLNISSGKLDNADVSKYLNENEVLSRTNLINNKTISTGISLDNDATLLHKFMKPRRQLNLNYNLSTTQGNSTGSLNSFNKYSLLSSENDSLDQKNVTLSNEQTHIGTATYTEPITKKFKVEIEYLYEYGVSSQDKETKNGVNGVYSIINYGLTNNFENLRQQHRLGSSLIYESRNQTITGGIRIRNIAIDNQNITTSTTINQNISNYLPKFNYSFKPSQSKRFSFNYITKSAQPSVSDLQQVQNNSNPNRIVVGNPNLKPNYEHSFKVNFNTWQALSGRYFWTGFSTSLVNNAFANSINYDAYGRSVSQTVNVDGNISTDFSASAGIPFFNKHLEISPTIRAGLDKYSNLISYNQNTTRAASLTSELEFEVKYDSIELTFGGEYTYTNVQNSISSIAANPFSRQVYSTSVTWILPLKFKIISDATYTINSQRSNGYNINYFVWNASINKTFTKTDNLILSLYGYDIFNQNISALREVVGNITTDNRTKIISRYFLLKLVYKFNNNKTKEEDAKMSWH